jgi:hypothetical protein
MNVATVRPSANGASNLSLSCSGFFGALLISTAIRVSPKLAGLVRLFNGKAARGSGFGIASMILRARPES